MHKYLGYGASDVFKQLKPCMLSVQRPRHRCTDTASCWGAPHESTYREKHSSPSNLTTPTPSIFFLLLRCSRPSLLQLRPRKGPVFWKEAAAAQAVAAAAPKATAASPAAATDRRSCSNIRASPFCSLLWLCVGPPWGAPPLVCP